MVVAALRQRRIKYPIGATKKPPGPTERFLFDKNSIDPASQAFVPPKLPRR
jgi:hypothetical protein